MNDETPPTSARELAAYCGVVLAASLVRWWSNGRQRDERDLEGRVDDLPRRVRGEYARRDWAERLRSVADELERDPEPPASVNAKTDQPKP